MGWQPGAVNSNFALQSSALILIGGFIRIIKVDSIATSCIHFGGIDAKPLLLQMNAYSLSAAEIRTKNGRIVDVYWKKLTVGRDATSIHYGQTFKQLWTP